MKEVQPLWTMLTDGLLKLTSKYVCIASMLATYFEVNGLMLENVHQLVYT